MQTGRGWLRVLGVAVWLTLALGGPAGAQVPANAPPVAADGSPEARAVQTAARALGWPTTVDKRPMRRSQQDEETLLALWPPENGLRLMNKRMYTATNGGSFDKGDLRWMRIVPLGEQLTLDFMDVMYANGLSATDFQSKQAARVRYNEEMCGMGGLYGYIMKAITDMISKWVSGVTGEPYEISEDEACMLADAGVIVWSCNAHVLMARDDTGQGAEEGMAQALLQAAVDEGLCTQGDTLVLMAGTGNRPNTKSIADTRATANQAVAYFKAVSHERQTMSLTLMDADGPNGAKDGYIVAPGSGEYEGKPCDFARAAVAKAFAQGTPGPELRFERALVVFTGKSKQTQPNGWFGALCCWPDNGKAHEIEVGPPEDRSKVIIGAIGLVGEEDPWGVWAHELAHTLPTNKEIHGKFKFVSDRYNYNDPAGKYGDIDYWGLMGGGNWWGNPRGSAPTRPSAFTQETLDWLTYRDGEQEVEYREAALERLGARGTVLRYDDPLSVWADHYFIVEARDGQATYGAPESGVVFYQVTWDRTHQHSVVNALTPQYGPTSQTTAAGISWERPTMHGLLDAQGAIRYSMPDRKLELRLVSENTPGGYSAVVKLMPFDPASLTGVVLNPGTLPAVPPARGGPRSSLPGEMIVASGPYLPLPDLDLHAYDAAGGHVGLNYATGEYEHGIPGNIASGDLKDAPEWIYVPAESAVGVRYVVSSYKTEQFLQASPEYRETIRPQQYALDYQRIDAQGVITVARGERGKLDPGAAAAAQGPDTPGLAYKPLRAPGYGRNLPANVWWAGLLAALGLMGVVGWIVALARR